MDFEALQLAIKNEFDNRLSTFHWGFTHSDTHMILEIADGVFKGASVFEIHENFVRQKLANPAADIMSSVNYTRFKKDNIDEIVRSMVYGARQDLAENPRPFIIRSMRQQSPSCP